MAGAPQGYIGRNPSDGRTTINRQTFNVTTGVQTSFTFTSGYDLGYFDVYLNGIKQNETTDYTAADGSTFSFSVSTPAVQGDTIEAIAYKSFNTTNVTGSTRDFNVGRNLDVAGNVTIGSSLTIASDLVVNGSYTYVNTEILDIEDKTVGIASTSAASNTTADGAGIVVYGGSDGDKSFLWNKTKSNWVLVGGGVSIGTGCTIGSSTANVLEFSVDGAVNAKLNNYGAFIVGDGVAGEAWGNSYKTVQAGSGAFGGNAPAANAASYWTNNAYFDDVNSRWEYIAADEASRFEQGNGALAYYNASAGSADGAITWSERLRVDASGNLSLAGDGNTYIGHPSPDVLAVTAAGSEVLRVSTAGGVVTGILTATSFSGPMSGTTGTFTGDVSIADKIVHIGDTNTAIRFPAADTISFETSGGEQLRISSGGQLLSGLTTPYATVLSSQTPKIQLESTTVGGSSMFLLRDGTDAGGPFLFLGHGRGGATIVQDDDELGNITFVGADGTNFQNAAAIKSYVDGTPGSGTDMPGRLSFWTTPDGSTTMAERLRITADGKYSFGTGADPSSQIVSYVSDSGDNLFKFVNSTTSTSANDGFDIGIDSDEQAKIWLYENDNMRIGTNDTERIRIKSSGQVGIATGDPYAPLHVSGTPETSQTGNFADNGILLHAKNAGSHAVMPISCSFTSNSYLPRAAIGFIARPSVDPLDGYSGAIGFYVASRADGSGLTMNDEVVRITKDGNVAIGNTGAGYYGPANDLVAGNTSGDHGISIVSGTADAGVIAFADAASSTSDAYRRGQIIYMHNTDAMHFRTGGNTDRFIIDQDGNTTQTGIATASDFVGDYPLSNRRINMNGDFIIAQRGTSQASVTSNGRYVWDRWYWQNHGPTVTLSQDATTVPVGQGFRVAAKIETTTAAGSAHAGNVMAMLYSWEGQDLVRLKYGSANAESLSISFWARSSQTGVFVTTLKHDSKIISKQHTISTANTYVKYTWVLPGDTADALGTTNTNSGMTLYFYISAGTNTTAGGLQTNWGGYHQAHMAAGNTLDLVTNTGTFYMTGLQVEVGETVTPYEHTSYGQELARCQRYYYTLNNDTSTYYWFHPINSGNYRRCRITYPVTMRTNPTITNATGANNSSAGTPTGTQHVDIDHCDFHWDVSATTQLVVLYTADFSADL